MRIRFVKQNKVAGRWLFLIAGVLVTLILFAFAQNLTDTANAEEKTSSPTNFEESAKSQIGCMQQIEKAAYQEKTVGMSARTAHLDQQYVEQPKLIAGFSEEEILLLQKVVFAEAGTDLQEAQKGVASAILNRLASEKYPNTIAEVVFAENQFSTAVGEDIYFFDWVDNETCYHRAVTEADISDEVKQSVLEAINGDNPIGSRTCFYSDRWISDEQRVYREGFTDKIQIGDTVFHGDWE